MLSWHLTLCTSASSMAMTLALSSCLSFLRRSNSCFSCFSVSYKTLPLGFLRTMEWLRKTALKRSKMVPMAARSWVDIFLMIFWLPWMKLALWRLESTLAGWCVGVRVGRVWWVGQVARMTGQMVVMLGRRELARSRWRE